MNTISDYHNRDKWSKFVDLITIVWLAIFFLGLFSEGIISNICDAANLVILIVFLIDLIIVYRYSKDFKNFFKKHWFDVLMIIPYFRIFRITKFTRVFRILKIKKFIPIVKKISKLKKTRLVSSISLLIHELMDLMRTLRSRFLKI